MKQTYSDKKIEICGNTWEYEPAIKPILNPLIMKHFKYIVSFIVLPFFVACNFINPEEYTIRSADQIATNMTYLSSLRVTPYSYLPQGYNTIGNSWLAAACDEAEEVKETETIQNFNFGNWSQYSNPDDAWSKNYKGIRAANDFLQMTDTITWADFKLSNPTEYATRVYNTKMWRKEMYFLRAFFYFELIKRYGGVPLVTEKLNPQEDLDYIINLKRDSFSECVDYIVNQCDTAAKYLLTTQVSSDYGVPTKGAAMALKARALLYAASDLYNKEGNADPVLGYTDGNRQQRWIKAADACKAVLDMSPQTYALNSNYANLFLLGSAFNKEVIFERRAGSSNTFEKANYSIGFNGGNTGTCPTQNLVDAYEMNDGTAFDWNNPVHRANPYANRDPRLSMTIACNYSVFNGRLMEMWNGGKDGKPLNWATKTGYYLSKYIVQNLDFTKNQGSYHQWIFFRLAEMYLDYAEAMNEAFGPDDKSTYSLSAREAVNIVRARTGVAMPAIGSGLSKEQFRERIRNERRVELAFEDHRYWDVRRWGIGASAIGGDIRGLEIEKIANNQFSYTPFVLESRTFEPKMDLYPILQEELVKSDGNIIQNPGW